MSGEAPCSLSGHRWGELGTALLVVVVVIVFVVLLSGLLRILQMGDTPAQVDLTEEATVEIVDRVAARVEEVTAEGEAPDAVDA